MVGQHLTSTPIQQHQPSESPTATAATHEFQRKEHAADGRFEGASEAQGAGRQQQLGPHGAVAGAYPEKRTQQHAAGVTGRCGTTAEFCWGKLRGNTGKLRNVRENDEKNAQLVEKMRTLGNRLVQKMKTTVESIGTYGGFRVS